MTDNRRKVTRQCRLYRCHSPLNVELYVLATLGVGDGGGDDDLTQEV